MLKVKSLLFIIISILILQTISLAQETPLWITESNKHTQLLREVVFDKFVPQYSVAKE